MTQEEIRELFIQGIDCSQVVTGRFADRMGMEEDDARKMSSCFGGGMMLSPPMFSLFLFLP